MWPSASSLLLWLLFVAAGCLYQGVWTLKIKALQVPEIIEVGDIVRLSCVYDAEFEELYSVKWYKDDIEFFRFLPKDNPANQFFEIGDVEVDMTRSSNGTVYLKNTDRSAEGTYRCEVSADAPSFQSISSEQFMVVEDATPHHATAKGHTRHCPWTLEVIFSAILILIINL